MGRLRDQQTDEVFILRADHILGRGERCDTRYSRPEVSQPHARVNWQNGRWYVRDLGSANGTTVDGRVLRGGQAPLGRGQRIALGGGVVELELIDDAEPQPFAVSSSGELVEGTQQELYLPTVEDFLAVVLPEGGEDWVMTCDGEERLVRDGSRVRVGGVHWTLSLSTRGTSTQLNTVSDYRIEQTRLRFEVSQDETTVRLLGGVNRRWIDLGSPVHNYMLLTLARRRLADQVSGAPPAECGWLYRDELASSLRVKTGTLTVQLFRARDALKTGGWTDYKQLIQRRSEGQIRLAISDVEIASM